MTSPASNPRKNCHQSTYLFRAVTCVSILMSDMKCLLRKARKDFQHLDLFAQSVLRSQMYYFTIRYLFKNKSK